MSKFICMWDTFGIERVIDITEFEHEDNDNLLETIKTGQPQNSKFTPILQSMLLRARVNSHRSYEIYAISTTDDINNKDILRMFEENPQASAELIRQNGVKIFSDRANKTPVIT